MMDTDRLKRALTSIVSGILGRIDYLALYQAEVVSQSGQTLEVRPLDQRFPDMDEVPIWHGLPGVEVTVKKGAVVLIGFRDGDPTRPFAMLWQSETLSDVKLTASGKVEISASGDVSVSAGGSASVSASGSVSVEARTSASVKATGDVSVEGTTIHLGGSSAVLGAARMTDTVQAGPFSGMITKGSLTVFTGD